MFCDKAISRDAKSSVRVVLFDLSCMVHKLAPKFMCECGFTRLRN